MKKNVIFLLIDCFDYNKIGSNQFRRTPTPFLDQLKKNSLWLEKMYSQAPFTEGALIATMCGYDTLDRGGYLKRYKNCPQNMFEMMQKGGYEVYAQMWTHFYPSSAIKGIDCLELRPFSFQTLWMYRFEYYAQLYKTGDLEKQDLADLVDILKDNLIHWKEYYEMILTKDFRTRIIRENMDCSRVKEDYPRLKREIEKFDLQPEAYVEKILQEKTNHILFSLFGEECMDQKVPKELVKTISSRYAKMNHAIFTVNNKRNRRNNHLSFSKLTEYFKRSGYSFNLRNRTIFSQYLRNYYHITHYKELLQCIGEAYDRRKDWLSTRRMMGYFLDWEKNRDNKEKPYFAYMHTEDIHGQCTVFDICCQDEREIAEQMARVEQYLNDLPSQYKGNLGYDLGLLNLDRTIEWFYNTLKERGILQDTILVITSDHGCGTNYNPLRGEIQNFHDECYHVPFIVCGADISPCVDTEFHLTKDTMATIADLTGIQAPPSATGISIFSKKKRAWINQEYMGPGCPDLYRRPIWMCGFDRKWKVFIKVKLQQESFCYSLEEIFNLEEDSKELKNLAYSPKARKEVSYLIERLEKRWQVIKRGYSRSDQYEP